MINLLPKPEKDSIRKEYRLRVAVVSFAILSLALVLAVFSFLPTYLFTLSRYQAFLTESQSDETQSRISQVKGMEATVRNVNSKIDLLKSAANTPMVKDIFLEILESKTSGITITELSYDFGGVTSKKGKETAVSPSNISVTGMSSDRAALLAFKDALSQKKEFKTVDLPISSLVKDTDLSFSINLAMSPIDNGKTK